MLTIRNTLLVSEDPGTFQYLKDPKGKPANPNLNNTPTSTIWYIMVIILYQTSFLFTKFANPDLNNTPTSNYHCYILWLKLKLWQKIQDQKWRFKREHNIIHNVSYQTSSRLERSGRSIWNENCLKDPKGKVRQFSPTFPQKRKRQHMVVYNSMATCTQTLY